MEKNLERWLLKKKHNDAIKSTTITDPYVSDEHDIFDLYRSEDDTMDDIFDEAMESGVDTREPQY